uniref:Ribosomal protein S16 n=1 Tax=Phaeophyceae sp. TaxID=2249243 RepID=A0A8E5BGR9_9PHAE|nr:ribosomal protein S16 [Phaeophyceae sp.]
MLKMRLKRCGRKNQPFFKILIMDVKTKRDGKAIEELGFYNPIMKIISFNHKRTIYWLNNGVQPTEVIKDLLNKSPFFN